MTNQKLPYTEISDSGAESSNTSTAFFSTVSNVRFSILTSRFTPTREWETCERFSDAKGARPDSRPEQRTLVQQRKQRMLVQKRTLTNRGRSPAEEAEDDRPVEDARPGHSSSRTLAQQRTLVQQRALV
ncbi:hypothetical protein LR48_Vigan05g119700 [Vigna angularis]|uniref:Uncharacterized protein n=1 Tax=Phaseolus angularis TaxID=3914 RepID=A0A0L9UM09_PHAAN|nr:hypothetical protein LR48_Vigan05g119700 [Vigna angularis]